MNRRRFCLSASTAIATLSFNSARAQGLGGAVTGLDVPMRREGARILADAIAAGLVPKERSLSDSTSSTDFARIVLNGLEKRDRSIAPLTDRAGEYLSRLSRLNRDGIPDWQDQPTRTLLVFTPALRDGYKSNFTRFQLRPNYKREIEDAAAFIVSGDARSRYQEIQALTGVPWYVIGAIHFREAGSNFLGHLHNGDNLRQKTKNVPANHPPGPWPPNPWDARLAFRTSAIDALQKYKSVERWTVERALYTFESFNGFGYRDKNINSPYLWSYSDLYEKGGFPRDHYYDSNWVSKQAGLGLVIRAVSNAALNENILTFET